MSITWDVNPIMFSVFGREIRWYGLLWALGLLFAVYIVQRIFKVEKISEKWFDSLFIYMMVGTIAGARLGHCLFYDPVYYLSHPLQIIAIWNGGLASHGGVLGIIIAVLLYSKKVTHISPLWTFDRVVVPAGLTAALIRLGNLMNSEIYGGPTQMPWGFNFVSDTTWIGVPCHPTQIYEAIIYLLIFGVCMFLFWRTNAKQKPGIIIGVAMIGIFIGRFVIEYLKNVQEPYEIALRQHIGLDTGQLLSIPFVLWGVWLVWHANKVGEQQFNVLHEEEPQSQGKKKK